jgi:hypothetical protein
LIRLILTAIGLFLLVGLWLPLAAPLLSAGATATSDFQLAVRLAVSFLVAWIPYFALSRQTARNKVINFGLTAVSLLLLFGLLELLALFRLVDYRLVISARSGGYGEMKPWENPWNRIDRELIHLHKPGQRMVGETAGDLVEWLGVPERHMYRVDVQYDRFGFRNPEGIERAGVVIIGDSFVEAGLVPQADLFSSRLAGTQGVRVANLGQSGYGPQQELIVLKRFGLGLQPKVVLWLFFEGNDLLDVTRYEHAVRDWGRTVKENHGFISRSFTRNSLRVVRGLLQSRKEDSGEAHRRSGRFRLRPEEPLYFAYPGVPLSKEDEVSLAKAKQVLSEAAELSLARGSRFLLVYVPIKFRVYRDFCDFPKDGYGRTWTLNDLPERLRQWSEAEKIPFFDLTEPLKRAAGRGELVFFPDDGHWNSRGNQIGAEAVARLIEENGWLK